MCYLLIHILKITMSAGRSVIIHQTSAFVVLLCWHLTLLLSNFCWWKCKVRFFLPAQSNFATLLITHCWFLKAVQLYTVELSKPSFNSGLSRNDKGIVKSSVS